MSTHLAEQLQPNLVEIHTSRCCLTLHFAILKLDMVYDVAFINARLLNHDMFGLFMAIHKYSPDLHKFAEAYIKWKMREIQGERAGRTLTHGVDYDDAILAPPVEAPPHTGRVRCLS